MRELVGIGMIVIIVLIVWLNPGIVSGVVKSFTGPLKQWAQNPDSLDGKKLPWQIDPDKVKKAAGRQPDKVPGSSQDLGQTAATEPDAGQRNGAERTTPRAGRDPGEADPGYPTADAGESRAEKRGSETKTAQPARSNAYTEPTLGVHAVAVQRARGL